MPTWMTQEYADEWGVYLYSAAVKYHSSITTTDYEYFYADTATEALSLGLAFMDEEPNAFALYLQRRDSAHEWIDLKDTPWASRTYEQRTYKEN